MPGVSPIPPFADPDAAEAARQKAAREAAKIAERERQARNLLTNPVGTLTGSVGTLTSSAVSNAVAPVLGIGRRIGAAWLLTSLSLSLIILGIVILIARSPGARKAVKGAVKGATLLIPAGRVASTVAAVKE